MAGFNDNFNVYFFIVLVALLPFAFYLDRKRKQQRNRKYAEFGLRPVSANRFRLWARPGHFSCLDKMGFINRQHEHVMGSYKGHKIVLFTHSVADGTKTGKHQTAAIVELGKPAPVFVLRPEWVRDKLKSRLGHPDINFDTDTGFSSRYFLQGDSGDAVRTIFNDRVRNRLSGEQGLWVECDGHKLLVFKEYDRLVDGTNLENTLNRAVEIKQLIEGGAPDQSAAARAITP